MASSSFPLLTFPLLLLLVLALAEEPSIDRVQQACSHVGPHADLCIKSLLSYPESRTADLHQLAGLAIRYAANNGAELAAHIAAQFFDLSNNYSDSGLLQCLNDCSEHFIDAVEQLDTSTAALDNKAYGDLNTWVSAAMADATSCNEGCEEQVGKTAEAIEVKKKTDEFLNLCGIALALSKLVAH